MDKRVTSTPGHPEGLPPETHNAEQDPVGQQAQDVADDARRADSRAASPLESTQPASPGLDPGDPQLQVPSDGRGERPR